MSEEEIGQYVILNTMLETDRDVTLQGMRLLNSPFRENYLMLRERNRAATLQLLAFLARQSHPPQTVTMNIPLTIPANWDEPVRVIPSVTQLQSGVQRDVTITEPVTCSICQEEMGPNTSHVSRLRSCGHHFHGDCINSWFLMSTRCPVCRNDIRESTGTMTNDS